MASPTQTWVWVNSRSWWWTGRPGVLWSMGLQRVGHDWVTELNWTELNEVKPDSLCYTAETKTALEGNYISIKMNLEIISWFNLIWSLLEKAVVQLMPRQPKKVQYHPDFHRLPHFRMIYRPLYQLLYSSPYLELHFKGQYTWGSLFRQITIKMIHKQITELVSGLLQTLTEKLVK